MERRALLAVLLSALVLVVWFSLFPSVPPPAGGGAQGDVGAAKEGGVGVEGEVWPAAVGTQAEVVVLEGEGFRVEVSSAGGLIRSWTVEAYRDEQGRPQELVGEGSRPLIMEKDGPWNVQPYVVERLGRGLVMRWSDGAGNWVEKRLEVEGKYQVKVEVRAGGVPGVGGVVVGSELGSWGMGERAAGLGGAGFVARSGGKVVRVEVEKAVEKGLGGGVEFCGLEDQYFLFAFVAEGEAMGQWVRWEGRPAAVVRGAGGVRGKLVGTPKEHGLLKAMGGGLEETLSFGLFGFLSVAFLAVLRWIHGWVGNWGLAIVVLTAGIRLLLFPLTHKSTVAMRRMANLQPKIKAIQERYAERLKKDPAARRRMNEEIMHLYRKEGVNPLGGCLPMLVQLPILWALYTLFAFAIELRHQPFFWWIRDLSAKDPTYITPILMTISMVVQQRLAPQAGDPVQRRLFLLMPFIFGLMFMNFPAGLVLYWLVNNVLTIGQQLLTERLLKRAGV